MTLPSFTVLLGVGAIALACAEERKSEPLVGEIELSTQEKRGREHFMRLCNECHPGGESGVGPALNDKRLPAAAIRAQVRNGFGDMPAFDDSALADEELDDLIAFLEAVREHGN